MPKKLTLIQLNGSQSSILDTSQFEKSIIRKIEPVINAEISVGIK